MAKSFNQLLKEAKQRLNREQMSHKRSSTQTENYEDVRRRFLPNLAQGSAAGLLGAPDIVNAALQPFTGATKPVMGSDWIGEQLGANTDDTVFILGQFIDPLSTSASLTKLAPLAAAGIIKRKGGNWLPGNAEDSLSSLMRGRSIKKSDPTTFERMGKDYIGPSGSIFTSEEYSNMLKDYNLNRWIDSTLTKYAKNRMGTESDEVRKLAEEGIIHQTPDVDFYNHDLIKKRERLGVPVENLGRSELAKD